MVSSEFLITSLIVVLIPGTGVIYTVSTGLFKGVTASLFAALGCTLGIVPHLLASVFGLAALMHLSTLAFQVIKFAGVIYLLFLAWSMWRQTGALNISHDKDQRTEVIGKIDIVLKGFLINILNPKLSVFFLAFLPQFVSLDSSRPAYELLLLSAIFMLMTLLVFAVYGVLAHRASKLVLRSARIMRFVQRGFATTFVLLSAKLALTER